MKIFVSVYCSSLVEKSYYAIHIEISVLGNSHLSNWKKKSCKIKKIRFFYTTSAEH